MVRRESTNSRRHDHAATSTIPIKGAPSGAARHFKSAFAIRGAGAGHERKQDVQVQNAITLLPVMSCSCLTKLES